MGDGVVMADCKRWTQTVKSVRANSGDSLQITDCQEWAVKSAVSDDSVCQCRPDTFELHPFDPCGGIDIQLEFRTAIAAVKHQKCGPPG